MSRSKELKDVIVQAAWKSFARLDMSISPYPTVRNLLHAYTFKIWDLFHVLTFAWAIACVVIVQYAQARPFPFLPILETTILFAVSLSIPLLSQFLLPATQVIIYLWTVYWFRSLPPSQSISLPFHITVVTYLLLSFFLWLFGPHHSLQHFTRLTGYTNLMLATTFLASKATWLPGAKPHLTYDAVFAGLNTGLQVIFVNCSFPQHTFVAGPLFIVSILNGGLQDPPGFVVGIIASAVSFLSLSRNHHHNERDPTSSSSSSSISSLPTVSKTAEDKGRGSYSAPSNVLPSPVIPPISGGDAHIPVEHDAITRNRGRSSTPLPSIPVTGVPISTPTPIPWTIPSAETDIQPMLTVARVVPVNSPIQINGDRKKSGSPERSDPSSPVRRRHSVVGPRERTRTTRRPMSLDVTCGRTSFKAAPNPGPAPTPNIIGTTTTSGITSPSPRNPSLLLSPEVQARWNDDLFEVLERLGESSSRVAYKVRERRSGLVFVKKTFYPRQTSGHHIVLALLNLIGHQDNRDAGSHLVRCYGAYLPNGVDEGVRGIFEFCEGGSLQAISSSIAKRGGIVGEKVAGRIATGMLQGLSFLHSLNMVHLNIRPSNVLITQLGIVKLSEPEIPGEGAVALTDRFLSAVCYASPERIKGNPTNLLKSDVWALGMTLLEFVQNKYPYPPNLSTVELMIQIANGDPPQLQGDAHVTWSVRMKSFFMQCLLANEAHRPTAQTLLSNPWILSMAHQNVRMDRWIREVWG